MTARRPPGDSGITEINSGQHPIYSVLFTEDGKQVLSGNGKGTLQHWQAKDGRKIGAQIPTGGSEVCAAALSPDRKWLVCGLKGLAGVGFKRGKAAVHAKVWDAQTHRKVLDIKGHTDAVLSVDISPDSTKFVTGGSETPASVFIWSILTGEQLVGPLQHDDFVVAVRFSPNGDRIATATAAQNQIRIYDSQNGQQLLNMTFRALRYTSSWLTWSADGSHLLAASCSEVHRFDASSGSLLSKWSVPGGGSTASIALSRNQKFVVVVAYRSVSFWDASTEKQIGTVINCASDVWSIALSPNDDRIATGEQTGKVTVRSLRDILPDWYLTMHVSG